MKISNFLINNLLIAKSLEYSEISSYYKQSLLSLILNWKIITNRQDFTNRAMQEIDFSL